jgi:hypothetical protein
MSRLALATRGECSAASLDGCTQQRRVSRLQSGVVGEITDNIFGIEDLSDHVDQGSPHRSAKSVQWETGNCTCPRMGCPELP